jgi:hypothetical protein
MSSIKIFKIMVHKLKLVINHSFKYEKKDIIKIRAQKKNSLDTGMKFFKSS